MHLLLLDHAPLTAASFDPRSALPANDASYKSESRRSAFSTAAACCVVIAENPLDDEYQLGGYAGI